ncbi:peptidase S8 family protein [Podospora didyma]|uniref:Peptidase S8 family protein n=1 Tax=Podospora didyma TaxID=330526 RepID=A0AAE0KE71_9PEZI|nr:peptidase S8 family protein [Podospora didyma]
MAIITINGNSIDTEPPTLQGFGLVQETAEDSDYILIQTNSPLTKDIKQQLVEKEVVVQEKVSDDTYLCKYTPSDLSAVRELPFVTYANIYQQHFVIDARLKHTPASSSHAHPLLAAPAPTERLVTVDVEFHPDVTVSPEFISSLATAARVDEVFLTVENHKTRLTAQQRYLGDLAALDAVKSIRQVHPVKLHNNVARTILRANKAVHPVNGTQYAGEGQIVCVSDTGFDKGSMEPPNVPEAFKGRVKALYPLGRKPTKKANGTVVAGKASDPDGHGTHVCGLVLGDGASASMGGRIQGTAPKATLVMQSLLDSRGGLGDIPTDLTSLFQQPYTDHAARIHTNSWGSAPDSFEQLAYDENAREIDNFVATRRDMVILFAAGNDGMDMKPSDGKVDFSQVGSQAAAKNCILKPLGTDNRGPTMEGRIKPDIVAPGTCILSTRSSAPDARQKRHLNLIVISPDAKKKDTPTTGNEPYDRLNNVEQITVLVRAHNVSSLEGGQTFALAWKVTH